MAASKSSFSTAADASALAASIACAKRLFFGLLVEFRIGRAGIFAAVLLLLDADDVGGALIAGEQVLAVLGVEEFPQRLDAADDEQKIVLAFQREHGVDEIVPRALLAELDFQAVGEETQQIVQVLVRQHRTPDSVIHLDSLCARRASIRIGVAGSLCTGNARE